MPRFAAELEGADDSAHVALYQDDAGTLDRDVCSGAHGNSNIGGRQRRRIVDSIACHGNDVMSGPMSGHALVLVARLDACFGGQEQIGCISVPVGCSA